MPSDQDPSTSSSRALSGADIVALTPAGVAASEGRVRLLLEDSVRTMTAGLERVRQQRADAVAPVDAAAVALDAELHEGLRRLGLQQTAIKAEQATLSPSEVNAVLAVRRALHVNERRGKQGPSITDSTVAALATLARSEDFDVVGPALAKAAGEVVAQSVLVAASLPADEDLAGPTSPTDQGL